MESALGELGVRGGGGFGGRRRHGCGSWGSGWETNGSACEKYSSRVMNGEEGVGITIFPVFGMGIGIGWVGERTEEGGTRWFWRG